MKFADLSLDTLRFYLKGESETVALLYEFLFNHALQVVFLAPEGTANPAPVVLSPRESPLSRSASSATTACSPIRPSPSSAIGC